MTRLTLQLVSRIRAALRCAALAALLLGGWAADGFAADKRNVIIVLADDLGAGDLGTYGNTGYRTPNLDRMAKEGLRLDTFYATPLCTPTRVALMTGQYGFRNGFLGMHDERYKPAPGTPQREIGSHFTFADLMKSAGYATALAGKWQLSGKLPTLIHDAGFDDYRMWAYAHNLPKGVTHTGRWEGAPGTRTARYWHPSLMENGRYLPTQPNDYGPDLLHEFVVQFIGRREGQPFFVYSTSVLTHNPWEETPDPQHPGRRWPPGFRSNLEYLDAMMGRLMRELQAKGLDKKTVVFFLGDNGTATRGKGQLNEAGVRVPFIAWGPGFVKPAPGAERALADITDILPTLAELAGVKLPAGRVFDGKSLVPLMRGQTTSHRDWIYSFLDGGRMLRARNWLLELPGSGAPERLYRCGDSRDGLGYQLVAVPYAGEAKSARERFAKILTGMPEPRPRALAAPQPSKQREGFR